MTYEPPDRSKTAFTCPYCSAYSHQLWTTPAGEQVKNEPPGPWIDPTKTRLAEFIVHARCEHCNKRTTWVADRVVAPRSFSGGAPPNPDLPPDVQADYVEAGAIVNESPRGAAALLRLAIQRLCGHLLERPAEGLNLNAAIGELVDRGVPVEVQQALDVVRATGNDAVHPGQIDMKDNVETASALFGLINLIAERTLTEPRKVREMFDSLPESVRQQIERRDG
jgi:hypothetical protein